MKRENPSDLGGNGFSPPYLTMVFLRRHFGCTLVQRVRVTWDVPVIAGVRLNESSKREWITIEMSF